MWARRILYRKKSLVSLDSSFSISLYTSRRSCGLRDSEMSASSNTIWLTRTSTSVLEARNRQHKHGRVWGQHLHLRRATSRHKARVLGTHNSAVTREWCAPPQHERGHNKHEVARLYRAHQPSSAAARRQRESVCWCGAAYVLGGQVQQVDFFHRTRAILLLVLQHDPCGCHAKQLRAWWALAARQSCASEVACRGNVCGDEPHTPPPAMDQLAERPSYGHADRDTGYTRSAHQEGSTAAETA